MPGWGFPGQRRIYVILQVTQDPEAHRWFSSQLAFLDSTDGAPTAESPPTSTASVIVPVSTARTISCPTCGIYFPDIRSMRIHHAKEHKISLVNAQQEDASARRDVDVSEHALDGMPTCKHCNRTFPTFVVFKKHILNACPVLKGMSQATASASAQGPTQTSLGQSCRESEVVPMMKRPDIVQFVLNHSWRELLRDRSVCARSKIGAYSVGSGSQMLARASKHICALLILICGCSKRRQKIAPPRLVW